MYNIYMQNPHYKKFINVLNNSIRTKKKDPNSNYHRFIQNEKDNTNHNNNGNVNFANILDEKERKKISQNFFNTISSDEFTNEVKTQYDQFKHSNTQEVYKKVSDFYQKEDEMALKDKRSVELGKKFMGSVDNFIKNHKDEYQQDGIVTVDGQISTNPSEYISKETEILDKNYKEENYSVEDLDKIMKLDKIL